MTELQEKIIRLANLQYEYIKESRELLFEAMENMIERTGEREVRIDAEEDQVYGYYAMDGNYATEVKINRFRLDEDGDQITAEIEELSSGETAEVQICTREYQGDVQEIDYCQMAEKTE